MTIRQALVWATKELKGKKIKTASLDAEVLLLFTLKKTKEYLYTYPGGKLNDRQQELFKDFILRRKKYEPVAYLRNIKEFFGLNFYVDKNVLIPRSDTELLVEEVISETKNYKLKTNNWPQALADIGTGSGAIAITLSKNLPKIKIYATDISKKALSTAKKNAKRHKVKVNFLQGSLLMPIKNKKIDIITANLPYLDNRFKNLLGARKRIKDSLYYEPKLAWHGGKYGLEIYEEFFKQLKGLKNKPKIIFCEIGHSYINKLKKIVRKFLPDYNLVLKKNLAGYNRIVVLKKKGSEQARLEPTQK